MQILYQSLEEIIQTSDLGTQQKIMKIIQVSSYAYQNTHKKWGGGR